jgi:sugar phosphate isomerase/epimerase
MKIGCGTVTFREHSLEQAMEWIAQAGYDYVEPQATPPWCPHVDAWHDDPEKFRQRVRDAGFKGASALWAPHGAIMPDPECVAGITQAIRWAAAAGIPVVNAGDGRKPAELTDAAALDLLRQRLDAILPVAAECGVYLAIEPHGTFSLTAEGLQSIMALSSSPWLGINYDTANVHRATYVETAKGAYSWSPFGARQDEVATLAAVVQKVVHVHVKDVVGAACVALGQGTVKVKACIYLLRRHGYDGVLSLESEGGFTVEEARRMITASRTFLVGALKQDS